MIKQISALLSSALLLLAVSGCASEQLEISDSWVRSSDMSVSGGMTGMFMEITNPTSDEITLIGGSSESGMVEIHETVMGADGMQMQEINGGIKIPAGGTVVLQPGGLHVMIMNLNDDVVAGDEVTVDLEFDGHPNVSVTATAKPSEAGDEEYHSDMDME
jgi:copper(I)-binding protein